MSKLTLETLPKNILANIICFLEPVETARVWRLNKSFHSLLNNSNCATIVWKNFCKQHLGDSFEESLIDSFAKEHHKDKSEAFLNNYCLFFKHCFSLKWDPNRKSHQMQINGDYLIAGLIL